MIAALPVVSPRCISLGGWLTAFLLAAAVLPAGEAPPTELHQLIDQQLAPSPGIADVVCSDEEFIRRASLDLTGMPPLADEVVAFVQDSETDKRIRLIDHLLASPQSARHIASMLDLMIMERRANSNVSQDEWNAWLIAAIRENRGWNQIASEILSANGDDPEHRAAARFYLDRGAEPNVIARDIGRVFFGRDLQCAQCHDSPLVSDFLQADYQGLLAITATGYEVRKKVGDKDLNVYAERAGSDLAFESVFNRGNPHRTGPRLPGDPTITEPFFLPGEEYEVPPGDGVRSVPKFSRRQILAEQATDGTNKAFNENAANRIWSLMFGRGLVHPLDMIHSSNPPASAELLERIGEQFAASGFNIRMMLREIAISRAYQRPFDLPSNQNGSAPDQQVITAEMIAQQEEAARTFSLDYNTAAEHMGTAESTYIPAAAEYDAARNKAHEANKKLAEANAALEKVGTARDQKKALLDSLGQATEALAGYQQVLGAADEIAGITQALTAKQQAVESELAPLQKAMDDALAAVAAPRDAVTAARAEVTAAHEKLAPMRAEFIAAEDRTVAARRRMQIAHWKLETLEQRFEVQNLVEQSNHLKNDVTVQEELVETSREVKVTAAAAVSEYQPVVARQMDSLEQAKRNRASAEAELQKMAETAQKLTPPRDALQEAVDALRTVREIMPEDASIVAIAEELNSATRDMNQKLEEAVRQQNTAEENMKAMNEVVVSAESELQSMNDELQEREQRMKVADVALSEANQELQSLQARYQESTSTTSERLSEQFSVAGLKPLTPEQLCWSIFKVTGVYDRYRAAEIAELEKTTPLSEEQKLDAAFMRQRELEIEQRTYDKLKGNVGTFVQFYGGGPGQPQGDFYASPDQALFTSNGGSINSWIAPAADNPTDRMIKASDNAAAAQALYLGILSRMPSDAETADVVAVLEGREDRNVACQELVWAVLTSAEFRFNH
ncbi:MAG: DUF1549 domain-containing protein [Planctomycetaceae bacterium]|nr:DUF1549 domain-containing protein [Planctomycetaceae bacterium]